MTVAVTAAVAMDNCRVEIYEDGDGRFHFQPRQVAVKNQNQNLTLCGESVLDMRESAWFNIGDRRGRVHFDRACEDCREGLVF